MTRGDCEPGGAQYERPCLRVNCRYNLGGPPPVKRGRPSSYPRDESQSCALDVAAAGPSNLVAIGHMLGVSRERIRQLEVIALRKAKVAARRAGLDLGDIVQRGEHPLAAISGGDDFDSRGRPRERLREGQRRYLAKKLAVGT